MPYPSSYNLTLTLTTLTQASVALSLIWLGLALIGSVGITMHVAYTYKEDGWLGVLNTITSGSHFEVEVDTEDTIETIAPQA